MTEEQIAYQDVQMRQQALNLADKRAPLNATVADVVALANTLLAFLTARMKVAEPSA